MPQRLALIVDDDRTIRLLVMNALRVDGYLAIEADNGMAALHLVRTLRGKIDVIVTDIQMPRMDGSTFAAQVAKEFPAIPILLMSGFADEAEAVAARLKFPFLSKPFTAGALREAVAMMLNRRHRTVAR
jgi:DNA-binding NtrC family response regulator